MKRNVLYWHGTPVAVVTDDGVFPLGDDASLLSSGAPAEILERLGTVLRSGLPEGVRFDILKHRMRTENRPLTVAAMLSQVLDLPGGFSISETDDLSGPLEEANAFYAPIPPEISPVSEKGGKRPLYTEPRIDVRIAPEWFNAVRRLKDLQPRPSFSGVQDKFTAVLEAEPNRYSQYVLRPTAEGERGNVIVKPHNPEVPFMAEMEFACMTGARLCGLEVPDCFLFEDPVDVWRRADIRNMDYGVVRFDLPRGGENISVVDAATMMNKRAKDKYDSTVEALFGAAKSILDSAGLCRLALSYLYGYLIGNGDMHLKNFSFIRSERGWSLSPLYDMTSTNALRYESKMCLPVSKHRNDSGSLIAFLAHYVSSHEMLALARRVEGILPDLARQVLARSDREGHHLGRSSLRRLSGTVRKRTAELHDLLREPERVREKMQTMPEPPVFER